MQLDTWDNRPKAEIIESRNDDALGKNLKPVTKENVMTTVPCRHMAIHWLAQYKERPITPVLHYSSRRRQLQFLFDFLHLVELNHIAYFDIREVIQTNTALLTLAYF